MKLNKLILEICYILLTIILLILLFYLTYKVYFSPYFGSTQIYNFSIFIIIFLLISLFILRKSNKKVQIYFFIVFFSSSIPIITFETYLEFNKKIFDSRLNNLIKKNIDFDTRSKKKVLFDLRKENKETYLNFLPIKTEYSGIKIGENFIYPIGGVSNITTFLDNENGYFPIIKTDKYGFNNLKHVNYNNLDIIILGDSFAEGQAVNQIENLSSNLNKYGYKTISLGKSANGPLTSYATLKEYVLDLKPKIVLWLFFEGNDIILGEDDLGREMESQHLLNYINDDEYTQNLIFRQREIDQALKVYFKKIENENFFLLNILRLKNLRDQLNINQALNSINNYKKIQNKDNDIDINAKKFEIFYQIFKKTKKYTSDKNIKLYFIFLPDIKNYNSEWKNNYKSEIISYINSLEITIIDIEDIFNTKKNPLEFFPYKLFPHYNSRGYALISDAISKQLEKDGYISTKLKH